LARQILEHFLSIEKLKVKNAEEHNRLRSIELNNQIEIERLRAEAFRLYHLNQNETALQETRVVEETERMRIGKTHFTLRLGIALVFALLLLFVGAIFIAQSLGQPTLANRFFDFMWPVAGLFFWLLSRLFKATQAEDREV
jgi:hypothetical protein